MVKDVHFLAAMLIPKLHRYVSVCFSRASASSFSVATSMRSSAKASAEMCSVSLT